MKPLTKMVADYIEESGIKVIDSISLKVSDNLEVGRLDPMNLVNIVKDLDVSDVDAVVLSACVQMPSLPAYTKSRGYHWQTSDLCCHINRLSNS